MIENKVVLLDRDGVLNRNLPRYVRHPDQLEIIADVPQSVARLTRAGYRVCVVTNQAGVGKGMIPLETLSDIHRKLHQSVAAVGGKIDDIFYCPHVPEDHCLCRKPKPGLILQAQEKWSFKPDETWFVGDTPRDMQAARAAHCLGAFVLTGHGAEMADQVPDRPHFQHLPDFVSFLLG